MGDPDAGQRVPIFVSLSDCAPDDHHNLRSSDTLIIIHNGSAALSIHLSSGTVGSCDGYRISVYMVVLSRRGTVSGADIFLPTARTRG